MWKRWAGLALVAGGLGAVPAARAQYSPDYGSCMGRAHGDTVQGGMCAQAELTRQDARLNKAYTALMGQLGADGAKKVQLRDDERGWIKKRDYACKVDGQTIDNGCLVEKTAARADELEKRLKF